jgi:hypothetical protein
MSVSSDCDVECTVIISYSINSWFSLPQGVKLLSVEENKKAKEGTPFSWWIKWDTLHWYDTEGVEHEEEGSAAGMNGFDFKRYDEGSEVVEYK